MQPDIVETLVLVVHVLASLAIIGLILIQQGKGAEAGLMSSASDSVFTGAQQGNILSKITTVLTVIFLANCIILAKMQSGPPS